MEALGPLRPRSVVDEAFHALRAQILHGAWAPGERIPTEHQLARTLGVGRSTVREALGRLASAGLLSAPHGGSKRVLDFRDHAGLEILAELVVSPQGQPDLGVVRAVTEMRAAIAPDVARLAALRRSQEQAEALVRLAVGLSADTALEELLEQTLSWWTVLVLSCDNLAYRLAYNTLRTTYTEGRAALIAVISAELRATERYVEVSQAVLRRDAAAAEAACRALIALGTRALIHALDPGESPCP